MEKSLQTRLLPPSPDGLRLADKLLQAGSLVAFPTDTVYGVGSLAFNRAAVESIYEAKDRPVEKAIPILIADPGDLAKVALNVPEMASRLAARFWPGPLTLLVPKHPDLPLAVSATDSVGVRVPDHPVALSLLRLTGPMAVTSANISGGPNPSTAEAVMEQLGGRVALIIDGGKTPGGLPSTVVDCTGTAPKIVREGPIKMADIQACLIG